MSLRLMALFGVMIRNIPLRTLIIVAALMPLSALALVQRPQVILFIDESDLRGPFYYQIFAGVRDVASADGGGHVTLYNESLDLSRFSGTAYEQALKQYLKEKYRGVHLGAIVSTGLATTSLVLEWRDELWPGIPVIFAMLNVQDSKRAEAKPDVTGVVAGVSLADAVKAARIVVPDLDTIVLVGDAWDRLTIYRNWKVEISTAAAGLKVIEIVGQKMSDIRRRVAGLPERSAIIYSAVYSDGEGTFYPPAVAIGFIAERANRPIVVAAETFLGPGRIGGYVLVPREIGESAARLALRVLNGASVTEVAPVHAGVMPIFNWQEMQRWHVSESSLPEGGEIRFRQPTFLQKYRWQSAAIAIALSFQACLIAFLLQERHRRFKAEIEARNRMSELAHVNRQATTGELTSSIAHELNQPLGSILTNAETAELILRSQHPDLEEIKEILADIKRDDHRAAEVIRRVHSFLRRTPFETKEIDLNEVMKEAFGFMAVQAAARNVVLHLNTVPGAVRVNGDPIQLQQVILNLVVNSMDAMAAIPSDRIVIGRTELLGESTVKISIADSGLGIPPDKLGQVFDPFFTTKEHGMGIGLSIARTIIVAHTGKIWAENQSGGAVFYLTLPMAG